MPRNARPTDQHGVLTGLHHIIGVRATECQRSQATGDGSAGRRPLGPEHNSPLRSDHDGRIEIDVRHPNLVATDPDTDNPPIDRSDGHRQHRRRPGEPGGPLGGGPRVHLGGRAHLDQPAAAQDGDPVGDPQRLASVMGGVHGGCAGFSLPHAHLQLERRAQVGVQMSGRLVGEQVQRCMPRQRPGQADPLLLPTGQLRRAFPREVGDLQAFEFKAIASARDSRAGSRFRRSG